LKEFSLDKQDFLDSKQLNKLKNNFL